MDWKKWLDSGALRPVRTGRDQAHRILESAASQLDGAGKIASVGVHAAARDEAYGAMLKAGLALILAHGYRPEAGSHHLTTVRVVSELLGPKRRGLAKAFNDMRKDRHQRLYEGVDLCTPTQASRAIDRAAALIDFVGRELDRLER